MPNALGLVLSVLTLPGQAPAPAPAPAAREKVAAPVVYEGLMLVVTTKDGVAALAFGKKVPRGVGFRWRYLPAGGGKERSGEGKVFEKYSIPVKTMSDRVRHVVQSCFNGKRIVIFSGGETKSTEELLDDVRGIAAGGGFGSIMGRNAFQRPRAESLKLLADVMEIFRKA